MLPEEEKARTGQCSKLSQILMEGEALLKDQDPGILEEPIRDFISAPDNGLDCSFSIENKSYQFLSDNESFCTDFKQGPFEQSNKNINKKLIDKILFKEIKFNSPPRRGSRYKTLSGFGSLQLMDPDDSLDIETGTFQRKRRLLGMSEPADAEESAECKNKRLFSKSPEKPKENAFFSHLPGFKTAGGENLYIFDANAAKRRKSLEFLERASASKPAFFSEMEVQSVLEIYKTVKQEIFPLTRSAEEEHSIFSLFMWTWISFLPQMQEMRKRGGESQRSEMEKLAVEQSKKRWKANPKSVLQRIVEKDVASAVYMKVLVVEEGTDVIAITDGLYSVRAHLDSELQAVSYRIKVGTILQIACSIFLRNEAMPIHEASMQKTPVIEIRYNGVKPCLSGPLGFQNSVSYIRALSSIKLQGGYVSCLLLRIVKHIETAYIVNIKGSKSIIDEERIDSTLGIIEKSIEEQDISREEKMKEFDSVKISKYMRYEVACEYSPSAAPAILSLWELAGSDNCLALGKRYLCYMLTTPKKNKASTKLLLTATKMSTFKLI